MQALPIDEEDLYIQRLYACAHKVLPDYSIVQDVVAVINPNALEKVGKDRQEFLYNMMEAYYLAQSQERVVN